jgi:death-on-curing protein
VTEPRWIAREALIQLHGESIATFGGSLGLRDEALLESALARPRNLFAYEPDADIARLAACYGVAIAKNHPFVDGNKRAAFLALGVFLMLNGFRLVADQAAATLMMLSVAAGAASEDDLTDWLQRHIRPG